MLWVGMALVVVGIVLVAKNSPHAPPGGKPAAKSAAAATAPADTVANH
jgi:hypothetical protein